MLPTTLLCTVGTSLFHPNLSRTAAESVPALHAAYLAREWPRVAALLRERDPNDRLCGAEINSVAAMLRQGFVDPQARICFFHSDTEDGAAAGAVLGAYFRAAGHEVVVERIEGLQDESPERFAREGLRSLARACCRQVRSFGALATAINATGGYKAQVAIAVLLGQALAVPVYYMHERFAYVIAFPPMPVALDFEYWMDVSGVLGALAREDEATLPTWADFDELDDRTRLAALVSEVDIDGTTYLELSPTGQIFHEAFLERFRGRMSQLLPPPATNKQPPAWEASGHMQSHAEVMRCMQRLTDEIPCIARCATYSYDPRLPKKTHARLTPQGPAVIFSNGTYTVRFRIDSTATSTLEKQALVAAVNEWIQSRWRG